jgi:hypothetical protein
MKRSRRLRANGGRGCGWIACWENGACRTTPQPDVGGWRRRWSNGHRWSGARKPGTGRRCGGAGAGDQKELLELIAEKQERQHYGDEMKESRRAEGRAFGEGDADAGALHGSGLETPEQRRPEEGAHGGAIARGNDDDMGMDQQALADGALENGRQCRAERMTIEKYTISQLWPLF